MRGFCITEAPQLSESAPQSNQENILCFNFALGIFGYTGYSQSLSCGIFRRRAAISGIPQGESENIYSSGLDCVIQNSALPWLMRSISNPNCDESALIKK